MPNVPLDEELEQYKTMFGVDLTKGCHAMVPILDMYNHHPNPNVGWEYNSNEKAFVITSLKPIPAGQEIIDSYGTYTDSHLFSKFGFVNGDGSGYTEATIAGFHKLLDVGMKEQFSYLPFSGERSRGTCQASKGTYSRAILSLMTGTKNVLRKKSIQVRLNSNSSSWNT